jgi:triacylglycerol lipase
MGRLSWSMAHLSLFAKDFKVLNFSYKSSRGTIEEHAVRFAQFIEKNCDSRAELYFIGHSLGCLITLRALELLPTHNTIRAVFLGPPLKGSHVAKIFSSYYLPRAYFGEPLIELSKQNPFEISKNLQDRLKIGVIAGILSNKSSLSPWFTKPNDFLVAVDETRVDGIDSHIELHCPHAVMMYAPKIIRATFNYLRHGRFNTL